MAQVTRFDSGAHTGANDEYIIGDWTYNNGTRVVQTNGVTRLTLNTSTTGVTRLNERAGEYGIVRFQIDSFTAGNRQFLIPGGAGTTRNDGAVPTNQATSNAIFNPTSANTAANTNNASTVFFVESVTNPGIFIPLITTTSNFGAGSSTQTIIRFGTTTGAAAIASAMRDELGITSTGAGGSILRPISNQQTETTITGPDLSLMEVGSGQNISIVSRTRIT